MILLLSGGIDGGTTSHVAAIAEIISRRPQAPARDRYNFLVSMRRNKEAREIVSKELAAKTALTMVDNLRPTLEVENLGPARDGSMSFSWSSNGPAPGYRKLMEWTDAPSHANRAPRRIMEDDRRSGEDPSRRRHRRRDDRTSSRFSGACSTDSLRESEFLLDSNVCLRRESGILPAGFLSASTSAIFETAFKNKYDPPTTIPQTLES